MRSYLSNGQGIQKSFMQRIYLSIFGSLRLLTLASALCCAVAYANEYTDISQLISAGKLSEAMVKVDQYLSARPKDPQLRFLKGVIQRDSGKTVDATSTFTRLIEDYPELPEPYNNLAVLYASQNQFDKARLALEVAIRTNPGYATAHENLGDVYAKLASQAYSKALQLHTTNPALSNKLAILSELLGSGTAKNQRSALPVAPAQPEAPEAYAHSPVTNPTNSGGSAASAAPSTVDSTFASRTPPANHAADTSATQTTSSATVAVRTALQIWANAWSNKDVKTYLGAYGKNFTPPGSMSRSAWEEERRHRIERKGKISVKLENVRIAIHANKATVKFRQIYKANGSAAVTTHKTLDLLNDGAHWRIVKESSKG